MLALLGNDEGSSKARRAVLTEPIHQPVPGSEQPGFSATYISAAFPQIKPDPRFPKTSYDCFELGLKTDPDADCLGERPWNAEKGDWDASYVWNSFATVAEQRTKVGAGLVKLRQQGALGNDAAEKYAVGIWCPNRPGELPSRAPAKTPRAEPCRFPAWQIVSQATAAYSLTLVSLYDTLGPNVVEYCINHSDTRIVFAAPSHLPQLLSLAKSCPKMKVLVSIDSWESLKSKATKPGSSSEQAYKAWGAEVGVQVLDIAEGTFCVALRHQKLPDAMLFTVEALGAANATPHRVPKPTDVASICYTSGVSVTLLSVRLQLTLLRYRRLVTPRALSSFTRPLLARPWLVSVSLDPSPSAELIFRFPRPTSTAVK